MDADLYQKLALKTEHTPDFVNLKGVADTRLARILHGAIGLATETGELQDQIKKHLVYGKDLDIVNVVEECGDCLWYIALVLDACGTSFGTAMERNIDKLMVRFGDVFTPDKALKRALEAERAALEGK